MKSTTATLPFLLALTGCADRNTEKLSTSNPNSTASP